MQKWQRRKEHERDSRYGAIPGNDNAGVRELCTGIPGDDRVTYMMPEPAAR